MKHGTFQVLLIFLDGAEEFRAPATAEELTARQRVVIEDAASRRRHSFALVAKRNWRIEVASRRVFPGDHLPPALHELWAMVPGDAVDRLIGYQDGDRWVPGMASLEPSESKALRWRVLELRATEDICRWLGVTPETVRNNVASARRKLKCLFAGVPA